MLHISHKQTTAHHPESNRAVFRLHCRLKDALRASAASRTPFAHALPLQLGPRSYLMRSSDSEHS
jgi:hypothetical protein